MVQAIQIENDIIPVTESQEYEYTMTTAQVAKGYGVSEDVIRNRKSRYADELIEGKHWVYENCSVTDTHTGNSKGLTGNFSSNNVLKVFWTKRGIVRLGFFIRSERAKKFRDLAEDLVLNHLDSFTTQQALDAYYNERKKKEDTEYDLMRLAPRAQYGDLNNRGEPKTELIKSYYRGSGRKKASSPYPFKTLFNYLKQ